MLTGDEIKKLVKSGDIRISDFDESRLNPNSYNLRISDEIGYYPLTEHSIVNEAGKTIYYLDSKKENEMEIVKIPEKEGIILMPGMLYLAKTMEKTYAKDLIPCISGRSSFARLGVEIHRTAGFGDIGVDLNWTLEITVVHPVAIYAGQEMCQIYFEKPDGETHIQYNGKYQNSTEIIGSRSFMDK